MATPEDTPDTAQASQEAAAESQLPQWAQNMNPALRHLLAQFIKFGVIGFVCFFIDWGVLNILVAAFHVNPTLAGTISFLISLVVNYVASMRYVFRHRSDMAQWMELVLFVICSVIGLGINSGIIWAMTSPFTRAANPSRAMIIVMTNIAKIIATIIVSVWNFVSRKLTIDVPRPGHEEDDTLARRIGLWSLNHGPKKYRTPASEAYQSE